MLVAVAPPGWTRLHGEFEPSSRPVVASVSVTTAQGQDRPLAVSVKVMNTLVRQQRSAAVAGAPWRRLVIDCHADGRLSARTEGAWVEGGTASGPDLQRLPRRVLAGLTAVCLIAAAVVFAVGWRWVPPPQLAMTAMPPPLPRQQEAFDVLSKWYDASNRADAAGLRALTCRDPQPKITAWVRRIERQGQKEAVTYPEAVTAVEQNGGQYATTIAVRERPLGAFRRAEVERAQDNGGFVFFHFVLVDEGGQLKVCDDVSGEHS